MIDALKRSGRAAKRTAIQAIPTVIGILILNFVVISLMPGDAADAYASMTGSATAETMARMREQLGLDQGLPARLIGYFYGLATLDLGFSVQYNAPVLDVVLERVPSTVVLTSVSLVMSVALGILFGWIMAVWADSWLDRGLTVISLLLYSTPGFWLGLMCIVVFSAQFGWLPSGGAETVGSGLTGWALLADRAAHLVLPALALGLHSIAVYARLTRASMLEVLRQDYMRAAAAKGLHPLVLQFRHGLRNALIPVTTVAGLNIANLLGGAVVVETVFSWPGLGRLTMQALMARDFSVLLGVLLLSSIIVIVVNMIFDVLITWLDPRIEIR